MDGEEDREGWKMAIHYLNIRLSKWAGSQTVPSFMRNPPNGYKYVRENVRMCVFVYVCVYGGEGVWGDIR